MNLRKCAKRSLDTSITGFSTIFLETGEVIIKFTSGGVAIERLVSGNSRLLALKHLLHLLLLLLEEGTDNAAANALVAARTSVCPGDALLATGHGFELEGANGGDSGESLLAVSALGGISNLSDLVANDLATGGLHGHKAVRPSAEGVSPGVCVASVLHHFLTKSKG